MKKILLILAIAATAFACKKAPVAAEISLTSPAEVPVTSAGETFDVTFTTNVAWKAAVTAGEGVTFTPASGEAGTMKISVTVAANTAYDSRSAELTITATGEADQKTAKVKITQNEATAVKYDGEVIEVSAEGGTVNAVLKSNVAYTLTSDADWVTATQTKGLADSPITIVVQPNTVPGAEARTATITATSTITATEPTTTIVVKQAAPKGVYYDGQDIEVAAEGGTVNVTLKTNVAYTLESDVDWMSATITKGLTDSPITIVVAPNAGAAAKEREGTITAMSSILADAPLATIKVKQAASTYPVYIGEVGYNTIQSAIDAATGDVIIDIREGEFAEVLRVAKGKSFTLKGSGKDKTIVNGAIEIASGITVKDMTFAINPENSTAELTVNDPSDKYVWGHNFLFRVEKGATGTVVDNVCLDASKGNDVTKGSVSLIWISECRDVVVKNCVFNGTDTGCYTTNQTYESAVLFKDNEFNVGGKKHYCSRIGGTENDICYSGNTFNAVTALDILNTVVFSDIILGDGKTDNNTYTSEVTKALTINGGSSSNPISYFFGRGDKFAPYPFVENQSGKITGDAGTAGDPTQVTRPSTEPTDMVGTKTTWTVVEGARNTICCDPAMDAGTREWYGSNYPASNICDGNFAWQAGAVATLWDTDNTFPLSFVFDLGKDCIYDGFRLVDGASYQNNFVDISVYVATKYEGSDTNWALAYSGVRNFRSGWQQWPGNTKEALDKNFTNHMPEDSDDEVRAHEFHLTHGRFVKLVINAPQWTKGDYIHGRGWLMEFFVRGWEK